MAELEAVRVETPEKKPLEATAAATATTAGTAAKRRRRQRCPVAGGF
jgi:hypothetical protein